MMKKSLSAIVVSLFCVVFSASAMDWFDQDEIENARPQLSFWLKSSSDTNIFRELSSEVAQNIPKLRGLMNQECNQYKYDCTREELDIFYTYSSNRYDVKNGIAVCTNAVVTRDQSKIEKAHQKFLFNLQPIQLARLSIMAKHFYEENFSDDLFDPWQKMISQNISQGIGKGDFFDNLFVGHEEQADHIFALCSEAAGINQQLNDSALQRSEILNSQNQNLLGSQEDYSAVRISKPTLLTQFKAFFAPYKNYIFGTCAGVMLLAVTIMLRKKDIVFPIMD